MKTNNQDENISTANSTKLSSRGSKTISIRLRQSEQEMLDYLTNRDNCEVSNPSELFRLLLHREFNRCKGIKALVFNTVASDSRTGRPKWHERHLAR